MAFEQLTVTRLERGQGWSPKRSGYQIAGCSPNVSDDTRAFVSARCCDLGTVFDPMTGPKALDEARKQSESWFDSYRTSAAAQADPNQMPVFPDDVMDSFPTIFDYVEIPGAGLYALIQVKYMGTTPPPDLRPHSFFAHALVFAPEELLPYGGNPMVAARSFAFLSQHDGNTQMASIESLGSPASPGPGQALLQTKPFSEQVDGLVDALRSGVKQRKPLKVFLPEWNVAPDLTESLLDLLPPSVRCRLSFCTFVNDKKSQQTNRPPQGAAGQATEDDRTTTLFSVICAPQGSAADVPESEYRADGSASVFNFTEGRFVESPGSSAYATFVSGALGAQGESLTNCHAIMEQLAVGPQVDAWDALLPAVRLLDGRTDAQAVAEGVRAAGVHATTPPLADAVLGWTLPHIRAEAEADNVAGLMLLADVVPDVANKASALQEEGNYQQFIPEIQALSQQAMSEGKGCRLQALLALAGSKRDGMLVDLIEHLLSGASGDVRVAREANEDAAFVDLLLEGVVLTQSEEARRPLFEHLLLAAFQIAIEVGLVDCAWEKLAPPVLVPLFRADWKGADETLGNELASLDPRTQNLRWQRDVADKLRVDRKGGAWDAVAPVVALRADAAAPEALCAGVDALVKMDLGLAGVEVGFRWIGAHVRRCAGENDAGSLDAIAESVAKFFGQHLQGDGSPATGEFIGTVKEIVSEAWTAGRFCAVLPALRLCGSSRDGMLTELLQSLIPTMDPHLGASLQPNDVAALVDITLDGLTIASKPDGDADWLYRLLVTAFTIAGDAGLVDRAWSRVGKSVVEGALGGDASEKKLETVKTLLDQVKVDACPDGNFWLTLYVLEHTDTSPGRLKSTLEYLARVSVRCSSPADAARSLQRSVEKAFPDANECVQLLGQMTEAATEGDAEEALAAAYLSGLRRLSPEQRDAVREKLADDGVAKGLCREFIDEALPWDPSSGPALLKRWQERVFSRGKVKDCLRGQVAHVLMRSKTPENVLPLAKQLMPKKLKSGDGQDGALALCSAVALRLPLAPLPDTWARRFVSARGVLAGDAVQRLRLLEYMGKIEQDAGKPDWGLTAFSCGDAMWNTVVKNLEADDKKRVLFWWIDTFRSSGISMAQDAQALLDSLDAIGAASTDNAVALVNRLLSGRDDVSQVVAVSAFLRRALAPGVEPNQYADVAAGVSKSGGRKLGGLLKEHLQKGFFPSDEDSQKCLRDICAKAGLGRLSVEAGMQRQSQGKQAVAAPPAGEDKPKGGGGKGFFKLGKRLFGND